MVSGVAQYASSIKREIVQVTITSSSDGKAYSYIIPRSNVVFHDVHITYSLGLSSSEIPFLNYKTITRPTLSRAV